jgi:hypothetical protein
MTRLGRDHRLDTRGDYLALIGTIWETPIGQRREVVSIRFVPKEHFGVELWGYVVWKRPHWDDRHKTKITNFALWREWLSKAHRVL